MNPTTWFRSIGKRARSLAWLQLAALIAVAAAGLWFAGGHPASTMAGGACSDIDGDDGVTKIDAAIETSWFGVPVGSAPAGADLSPGGATINNADLLVVANDIGIYTLCQASPFTWMGGTPPAPGAGATDIDGDGCPDAAEGGPNQVMGGLRDYLNPWDYNNPSGDGKDRVDDILDVVAKYYVDFPAAGYTMLTDRTQPAGPPPWDSGRPDGLERVDDILAIVGQYFHDCS